jgi:hypothetical protein
MSAAIPCACPTAARPPANTCAIPARCWLSACWTIPTPAPERAWWSSASTATRSARSCWNCPPARSTPASPRWVCAVRELAEETGYRARQWARAGLIHPCVGYSDEIIEIWFARHLTAGPARLDPGEFLDVGTASLAELDAALASGQLTDGKSVAALLWLHRLHRGEWHPDWQAAPVATLADEPHPPA